MGTNFRVQEDRSLIVVGHSIETLKKNYGNYIDSFDRVMRFPYYPYQTKYVNNLGSKTTDLVVTRANIPLMQEQNTIPDLATWMFSRPEDWDDKCLFQNQKYNPICINYILKKWLDRFKELGARGFRSDENKDPMISRGTCGVLISCCLIKPKIVYTIGFENVWDSEFKHHDWPKERELIRQISSENGVKIKPVREV